jgi:RNA polymerase sigma-70 factor, ECF subfamily
MENMSERDNLLMAEYDARRRDETFAALVRQHINLVFATAKRQVGDHGAAEEITQNVFVALAQASGKLKSHPTIAGWLYRTTLNKSREWLRSELRRHQREQVAVSRELGRSEGDSVWSPLVPLLDEALMGLREPDRLAVIMHYLEGQTFHEVGSALGIGEDTARKRVNRCLDQLTQFFHRHGFAVAALTAGAPLFTLSSHAAPAGLTASVTSSGLAAGHSAASTSTPTLIKAALKFMAWTKTKTIIGIGIGVLIAAGTTTVAMMGIEALQTPAWQKHYDLSFVDRLPAQVKILPSLAVTLKSHLHVSGTRHGKVLGLGQSVSDILMMAYGVGPAQLTWNAPIFGARYNFESGYDYIANFPKDNNMVFQQAVRKTFGLAGRYETFDTNALILAVKFPNAPRLRAASGESSGNEQWNLYSAHGQGMDTLVNYLETRLGIVIVDQTQLEGNYDIDFTWDSGTREGLEQALLGQTGLELIPTNMTVQIVVIEPAK